MPFKLISKQFFTTLLLAVTLVTMQAQDIESSSAHKKNGYLASYWHNGTKLICSPVHWNGDDWAKAGGTIVITTVLISMDEAISQPFFNWQTNAGNTFGNVGKFIGSVPAELGFSGLALGAGAIAHNKPLMDFAFDNLQSQIFTGGITLIAKELSHRARPFTGEGAYSWYGPFKKGGNDYASFFSGHASLAFSTATMVFLHSKKKWWVGLISYSVSTGVALSRMQKQDHWASDVVLGSVMGTAIANFVYHQQEKRRHPEQKLKIIP